MKIGLISDTHGYMDNQILAYLENCDEIWHAGDIGNLEVTKKLSKIAPLVVVRGNIDEGPSRQPDWPLWQHKEREGCSIVMLHIASKPPKYNREAKWLIREKKPDIFIAGHSHILSVKYDRENKLLFINPGAAGHHGFHKMRTLIRFDIVNSKPANMEVVELGKRGIKS